MSDIKPRMAVAYHFFNDFDTLPGVMEQVRKTYDGPVSFATDYMVWNITKDDIKVRMAVVEEAVWPQPSITEKLSADPKDKYGFSDFIKSGRVVYQDVIEKIYENTNKQFGTNLPAPK
jgi:ribonuclease Z